MAKVSHSHLSICTVILRAFSMPPCKPTIYAYVSIRAQLGLGVVGLVVRNGNVITSYSTGGKNIQPNTTAELSPK